MAAEAGGASRPEHQFDAYAGDYDVALNEGLALSGEDSAHFQQMRVDRLRRILTGMGFRATNVLDFGCGTGSTVPFLLGLPGTEHVVATDDSPALLDRARAEHDSERTTFVELSSPPSGTIDLAYCNGVFHHIDPAERDQAVSSIVGALRPGGLFALWENNPYNPGTRMIMRRIPFDRDAIPLRPAVARQLVRRAGLDVVRTDFTAFFPAFLRALRPLEWRLKRVPLGGQYLVLAAKPSGLDA